MKKSILCALLMAFVCNIMCITTMAKTEFEVTDGIITKYNGDAENVVVPSNVNGEDVYAIGRYAFYDNDKLKSVTIDEGIEIILTEAFKNCYNLSKVTVPESLVDIRAYAFSGCYDLEPVELKSEWTTIDGDAYVDADRNNRPSFFAASDYTMNKGQILSYNGTDAEVVIPETIDGVTVTSIGASAFQNNKTITSVKMPNTITSIGAQAFYNCTNLKTIEFSKKLSSCGKSAFSNCTSLVEVTVPGSLSTLGERMFMYCTALTTVKLEEGVTQTNLYSFSECQSLTNIIYPTTIKRIESWTFGNSGLKEIYIPDSVTVIEAAAYYRNLNVKEVVLPDSVKTLGSQCFRGCNGITKFKMSPNVDGIQYRCFDGCRFTEFEVPKKTRYIGEEAFFNCLNLNDFVVYDVSSCGIGVFGTSASTKRNLTIYAPQSSVMAQYAVNNNINTKPIITENVAIIVGENSLGTYGAINYPLTDKVDSIGMKYIPEHLQDNENAPVLDIMYEDIKVDNGNTFMSLMTEIPDEAMNWNYVATPYARLKDGNIIYGDSKTFGLGFITTIITMGD